ncbi:MAG: sigma-70 family RNA polymerase sigma factor [Phycisphaerales bacterium]|nr:sigma-70 family RNA polymerase sigma factor [Phycisphaerales bacterium]
MTYGLQPPEKGDSHPATRSGLSPQAAMEDVRRRLVRYAVKLVWNRADAEEIVQDAFKIAATRGVGLRDEHFEPWMFRTTGQLCLNHRRKRRPESLDAWIETPTSRTPEDAAMDAERLESLRAGIEQLPDQQRIALTLRCIEQFDYSKVADIMAITESAVRAHVHQARRKLADTLGDTRDT